MLEPIEDQYMMIGHIARSHGVHGEVLIISDVDAPQLFDEIDLAHIQNARGDLIPARIESVRVQQKNNRLSFFVKFEHVPDRNRAEELKSFCVFVARDKIEALLEEDHSADLTTFTVEDADNKISGYISEILNNPAHPILQVITDNRQRLLIPFVDEYVVATDEKEKIIRCKNLDKLADV